MAPGAGRLAEEAPALVLEDAEAQGRGVVASVARLVAEFNGATGHALTIGNVILYSNYVTAVGLAPHEIGHTYQGEALGQFYLPLHVSAGVNSIVTSGDW